MSTLVSRRGVPRAVAGSILLAAAVFLCRLGSPLPAAAAQSDLTFTSDSVWTAEPSAGRIHVQTTVKATSHAVDVGSLHYFYDRIQLALPPFSAAYSATSSTGRKLPITVESVTRSSVVLSVGLAQRLYAGQTGTFNLAFDLVDSMGSTDRDFRISGNVISFPVWAFGSPNTPGSTVTVSFPPGFTVQEEFGGLSQAPSDSGRTVFTSGPLPDATELDAWFTAVKPVPASGFRVRYVVVGPLIVSLRYWGDDPGWADQVERVLQFGFPVLKSMIGLGDPAMTSLTVEEASTEEIGGFSGAYESGSGMVLVSYFADPFVILHETAHLWFNSNLLGDRWAQEGFASYYAEQAVARLGYTDHAPVLTDRMRQSAVPLNDWVVSPQANSPVDAYLYGASLEVAKQIAATAGQAGLTRVWTAATSGALAFQPADGARPELGAGETDWRRLLDLLEQTTNRSYSSLWASWVVDPSETAFLEQRDTALAAFSAAQSAAGSWNMPLQVRASLAAWRFAEAIDYTAQARGVLNERNQIVFEAAAVDTTPPPGLRTAFEKDDLATAAREAGDELTALAALSAARQAQTDTRGAAVAVGLLGSNPDADLTAARAAFARGDLSGSVVLANRARAAWQNSNGAAQARIVGLLCVLIGGIVLLLAVLWYRGTPFGDLARRGRRGTGATAGVVATAAIAGEPGDLDAWPADFATSPGKDASSGDGDSAGPGESAYDLLQRGHLLLRERHNAQAAVVLERAARLEKGKASILEALGRAYFDSGQHARAAEVFEALLEVDPAADYGHFGLGLSLARLGRTQEAQTHLRLAAAMNPSSDAYRSALRKIEASGLARRT